MRKILASSLAAACALGALALPAPAAANEVHWVHLFKPIAENVSQFGVEGERLLYNRHNAWLVLRDLRTGATDEIANSDGAMGIKLTGNWAAYEESTSFEGWKLKLHNLVTNEKSVIGEKTHWYFMAEDQFLYAQPNPEANHTAFWLRHLESGEEREVLRFEGDQLRNNQVGFDGRFITFMEAPDGLWAGQKETTLIAHDLTDEQRRTLHVDARVTHSDLDQGRLLYVLERSPIGARQSFEIRLWDIAAGTDRLVKAGHVDYAPPVVALQGSRAAWVPQTIEADRLHLHDLVSGAERTLPVRPGTNRLWLSDRHAFIFSGGNTLMAELDPVPAEPKPAEPRPGEPTEPVFYTVKPGETLWQIASRYGLPVVELVRANNMLTPDWIYPGQSLFLPYPVSPRHEMHVVKAGETMASIAVQYRTTVSGIMKLYGTASEAIHTGQRLRVNRGPVLSDSVWPYQAYAVMPGDTLWNVSHRTGFALDRLLHANSWQKPAPLKIGQTLIVPWDR
ncbi:MAG: LysM peptidoglycan-binding domain-containing protein [Bacillota bacterium]